MRLNSSSLQEGNQLTIFISNPLTNQNDNTTMLTPLSAATPNSFSSSSSSSSNFEVCSMKSAPKKSFLYRTISQTDQESPKQE